MFRWIHKKGKGAKLDRRCKGCKTFAKASGIRKRKKRK